MKKFLITLIALGHTMVAAPFISPFPTQEPVVGYSVTRVFTGLSFPLADSRIVGGVSPPDDQRLFLTLKQGEIVVITNTLIPTLTSVLNLRSETWTYQEAGLHGLAFHPGFKTNGLLYTFGAITNSSGTFNRLTRWRMNPANPNQVDLNSRLVMIEQARSSPIHQGGDLKFGPDGYLYVPLGDGDLPALETSAQYIDRHFLGAILRIDVDERPGNLLPNPHPAVRGGYRVPADNPWVGATSFNGIAVNPANVRTEFWAVGLRNPHRIAFEPGTGAILLGDVGNARWEEVNRAMYGRNYGWNWIEGNQITHSAGTPASFDISAFTPPLWTYPHAGFVPGSPPDFTGNCIIGGFVYQGTKYPQLDGKYLCGDYVAGHIWAISLGSPMVVERIAGLSGGLSSFALDPYTGDILVSSPVGWSKLSQSVVTPLPSTLSATGVFTNFASMGAVPEIRSYAVANPFWSDYAIKSRWFYLPAGTTVTRDASDNWTFPPGMFWVKHFTLPTNRSQPATFPLETRFIVKTTNGAFGLTYRWRPNLSDADLVAMEGANTQFAIQVDGLTEQQPWHFPARSECSTCHNPVAGWALGFSTRQLNLGDQLAALSLGGVFTPSIAPSDLPNLPRLSRSDDEGAPLEHRFKSYTDANCAYCHQPGGIGRGEWDARFSVPVTNSYIIDGPVMGNLDIPGARVIKPGDLNSSILFLRVADMAGHQQPGEYHMPPLATYQLNRAATNLLARYIQALATPNTTPILTTPPDMAVDEGVPISLNLSASDDDVPAQVLTFALVSGPAGLTVSPTGVLSWTPTEQQGPGSYAVVVSVTDNGSPPMTEPGTFQITVREVPDSAVRMAWQIGTDDNPLLKPYAPYAEFSVENSRNDARPGVVSRLSGDPEYAGAADPGADDDFYFAGTYPPGFNGLLAWLHVPNDEPPTAWERAHTRSDRTNRVHFVLDTSQVAPNARLRLSFELLNGGTSIGGVAQTGFGDHDMIVRFRNGVEATTQIFSQRVSQRTTNVIEFLASSVAATAGPNTIEIERAGPTLSGVSYWVNYDYLRMEALPPEGNTPPILTRPADLAVDELVPLSLQLSASDGEVPLQVLTYSAVSGPAGLTVSPTGVLSWIPTEEQGPGSYVVVVSVSDNGSPALTDTRQFTVTVREVPDLVTRMAWQIGTDDNPLITPYQPYGEFGIEDTRNNLWPGKVTRLPADPQYVAASNPPADDDFYFAGFYPSGFNGLPAALTMPNDEPPLAWERALTTGDLTNRVHLVLDNSQVIPGSRLRLSFELPNAGSLIGGVGQPGFGNHDLKVQFRNGSNVTAPILSQRVSQKSSFALEFLASTVGASAGPNTVEFIRTGPAVVGGSAWLLFDYVRLEVLPAGGIGLSALPSGMVASASQPLGPIRHGTISLAGLNYPTLTYDQPDPLPIGVEYVVEISSDLSSWSTAGIVAISNTSGGGWRTVTVRGDLPLGATAAQFLRLRVVTAGVDSPF